MIFKNFKKLFCIYLLCFSSLIFTSSWDKFLSVCCCCSSYPEKNESSSTQNFTITSVNERPIIYSIEREENKTYNNPEIVRQDNSRPLTPANLIPHQTSPISETMSNVTTVDHRELRAVDNNNQTNDNSSSLPNSSINSPRAMPMTARRTIDEYNPFIIGLDAFRSQIQANEEYTQQFSSRVTIRPQSFNANRLNSFSNDLPHVPSES